MPFDALTGNEVQAGLFIQAVHEGDDFEEVFTEIEKKMAKVFEGESAHKIVRITYQRGSSSFFTNAGFEKELYNDIKDYVMGILAKEYMPVVFNFSLFVSYSPLRVVNTDNVE